MPTCCYSSIENRFSRPQGQLGHIRIHIHDMHTPPHSSFLLASTHHSLTHSASGRFELRAASNSTLQYALGRMEKWKVGNWLKIRELLRLGLTASQPACQLAWLLFSILKAELGQMLFALSPLSLSLSLPRPMPQFKYLCKRAIL